MDKPNHSNEDNLKKMAEAIKKDVEERKQEEDSYRLLDFTPVKDFCDFGLNRSLIDNKIKLLTDIRTREALEGKKPEKDWIKIMTIILIAVIVGSIAFMIITQVMDYNTVSDKWISCQDTLNRANADLSACRAAAPPENIQNSGSGTLAG